MSAYFAVCFSDRIEVVTDGGAFDQTGTLTRVCRKIIGSTLVPVAVTGVGVEGDLAEMKIKTMEATELLSVDAAIDQLRSTLPGVPKHSVFESVILLAAISDTRGPRLLTWSNASLGFVDRGRSHAFGPGLSDSEILALGVDLSFPTGLREDGVRFLEAMRNKKCQPFSDIVEGYYVGGHVDWTVIDAAGVRIEKVHEWPDVVGKPITPSGAPSP